jgi:cyclase
LNEQEGRKLLDEIRKVSPLPVRWIVNTHYHPDHRGGNGVVGPDAMIISTSYTRERTLGPQGKRTEAPVRATVYETINSLDQPLILNLGGHEVRIYHPGPAHTLGDLVVYFPGQHAIATGDLFLTNSCPAMDDGDMENWITALDHILALPVDHVVPGHFEVASKNQLRRFRDYLAALREHVARMRHDGLSLEQLQKRLDMKDYKDFRQWPQYQATFADNAATYYKQLESRKTGQHAPAK